jgi:excisionase family DNA binding protein
MRLEIGDDTVGALQEALSPVLERLVLQHLERRRKLLVNIRQAADQLSCSEASVRTLIRDGRLEAIPWGRSYRIRWEILEGYVASLAAPHGWPVPTTTRERSYRHQARPAPVGQRALPATDRHSVRGRGGPQAWCPSMAWSLNRSSGALPSSHQRRPAPSLRNWEHRMTRTIRSEWLRERP